MTDINPKRTGLREFLYRIFLANSGVSSRRLLAVMFAIQLVILVFMKYPIGHCELIAVMIGSLLALTTISSYGQKAKEDDKG